MKKIKLSKKFQVRNRFIRNMLSSLILFEQIQTTPQKAKALQAKAGEFFNKISKMDNEVNTKRYIKSVLYGGAQEKAFDYRTSFKHIKTYRVANRLGDNAQMMIVKLVIDDSSSAKKEIPAKKAKETTKNKADDKSKVKK